MSTKIRLSNPAPSSTEFALTALSLRRPGPDGSGVWSLSVELTSDIGERRNFSWGGLDAKRRIHQIATGNFSTVSLPTRILKAIDGISGTIEGAEEGLTELETALLDGPGTILIANLPAWLEANVEDENTARRLKDMDTRATSKPIYDAFIDQLNGVISDPAV